MGIIGDDAVHSSTSVTAAPGGAVSRVPPPLYDAPFGLPDPRGVIYGGGVIYGVLPKIIRSLAKIFRPRGEGSYKTGGHIRGGGGKIKIIIKNINDVGI